MKILNSFSANMLAGFPARVSFAEISAEEAAKLAASEKMESAVGHADTASVFSAVLGTEVPMARITISLKPGETALLGQYQGPRLPEGSKTLPEGARIVWLLVTIS